MFIKIMLVICVALFLFLSMGVYMDLQNSKKIENAISMGTLVIVEPEKEGGEPELYLHVENMKALESDVCKNTGYVLFRVSRRKAQ
jgi:hypothetical protein